MKDIEEAPSFCIPADNIFCSKCSWQDGKLLQATLLAPVIMNHSWHCSSKQRVFPTCLLSLTISKTASHMMV